MPLTRKHKDYDHGGGFLIDRQGIRIDIDTLCPEGGVIVYSGEVRHGVAEIDPHKPFKQHGAEGRIVLMASLFKVFSDQDLESYRAIGRDS